MDAQTANPEHSMLKRLWATARFFDSKIGLHRLGIALSLTIITIAVVVLYRILRDIDPDALVDAIEATDWRTLIIASLFVAAGYLTLTFYDLFALRTIGRPDVPYRVAALSGFTSYAVGHNVGASVFSGGAVRYRIYSAWKPTNCVSKKMSASEIIACSVTEVVKGSRMTSARAGLLPQSPKIARAYTTTGTDPAAANLRSDGIVCRVGVSRLLG